MHKGHAQQPQREKDVAAENPVDVFAGFGGENDLIGVPSADDVLIGSASSDKE